MIKVIKGGTVITMDEKRKEQYEKLDIVIKDDKIFKIVKDYDGEYDMLIDATNKVVLPGLINAHTHLGMSIFRATNDSLTLNEWLENKIWPIENNLTNDDVYYSTLLSCIEMIKTGTTTSNDMYFNCDGSIKALKQTKLRSLFSRCLMDGTGQGQKMIDEFLKLYEENKDSDLIKFSVAVHSFYTSSEEYLKKCSDLALKLDLPLHIHFCENETEVNTIKDKYNMDPVDALEKVGMLRNKLILAHTTFISEDKLSKFLNKKVSFVHNPISNLNLGCGIANISKYKNYVNVCLGTDGQGSGNNLNLFYHMSMVDLLQKGLYKDPVVSSSYEVLKMATINGAKALFMDDKIGSIEVGKNADIIIVDLNEIETYPTVDVINNVVHNTGYSNVDTTIVNGEVLMLNHKLLVPFDEVELKKHINSIINRVM